MFRLIVAFAITCCISAAHAGEIFSLDTQAPNYLVSFADQHRWTVEVLGTAIGDLSNRHLVMGGATVGAGYYILDNLALQTDFTGYGFNEGHISGEAIGWTLGLRHHLLNIGKGTLFVDVSGGLIEASAQTPYGGTHFNDTFEVGPGVAFPLHDNTYLLGGVRYFHLSNANREGDNRNPSVNGIQGVFGVMFRF
jgi:Outer membrane protein beta-barrel domain